MLVSNQNNNISHQCVAYKETLIAKLPNDILLKIFAILSGMDLTNCMRVCSEWKNLTLEMNFGEPVC